MSGPMMVGPMMSGPMMFGLLALTVAASFTGAALYINLAEHPARMTLPPAAALAQWRPAYARGLRMQASLAVLGGVLGAIAWWRTGHLAFAAGGALMILNWPWTLLAMMPLNHRLEALASNEDPVSLLKRWNRLHAVRTLLGGLATAAFLAGFAFGVP